MKSILAMLAITLISFNVLANGTAFSCQMDRNTTVRIVGSFSQDSASLQIIDEVNVLGIRELKSSGVILLNRVTRKNESKYAFSKFYKDFNAWQDIEVAVPKTLRSKMFKSFLTVYIDDGDRMVPSSSESLTCVAK